MKKKFYFLLLLPVLNYCQKLNLAQCIDTALSKNSQIEKYNYYNNVQKINKKISNKEFLPASSLLINNNLGLGIDQDIFGNTKRNDNYNNGILINTQWLLYGGKKNRFNLIKNEFEYQSGLSDIETIKRDVVINTTKQYLQVLLSKEIYDISNNSVDNAIRIFNKTEKGYELGNFPKKEIFEAKSNLVKEKQRKEIALSEVKKNLLELALLLQINNEEFFDIESEFVSDDIKDDFLILDEVLQRVTHNDPKIKSLEFKLNSVKMQTEIAKTPMRPTVNINTNLGSFYFNSLVTDRDSPFLQQLKLNFYQQFRLNITIPIFSKGINKLQIEKSRINEDIAINEIEAEKKILINTIKKIFFDKNQNYKNYILAKEVEDNMRISKELMEKSYIEGYSTIYELNNSTKNWIESISLLKQFKYKYYFDILLLNIYSDGISNTNLNR